MKTFQADKGYSLVELMVAMVLSLVVAALIFKSYQSFSIIATSEDTKAEMQQNLRVALDKMVVELRLAGLDPTDAKFNSSADNDAFIVTTDTGVRFQMDWNEDGDFSDFDGSGDMSRDDIVHFYFANNKIYRADVNGGTTQEIMDNVSALQFRYFAESTTVPLSVPLTVDDRNSIKNIQVCLVIASSGSDYQFTDNTIYKNPQNEIVYTALGDHVHRRMIVTRVFARNRMTDYDY